MKPIEGVFPRKWEKMEFRATEDVCLKHTGAWSCVTPECVWKCITQEALWGIAGCVTLEM